MLPGPHLAQAAFPTSRDPQQWPFAWNSIWNMPIGSGAQYVSAGIGRATQMGMTTDEDVLILRPTAPLKSVALNDAGWDPSRTRCGSILAGQVVFSQQVPVPNDFRTDPGYLGNTPNMSGAILMPDGVTIKQTQPLHVCGYGGTVTSQYAFPDDNIKTGDGIRGAHGGSGMSSMGGTLRLGELVPGGVIRHALKLNIDGRYIAYNNDGTPGYRWPAVAADSCASSCYTGSVPALEMGALLALRPDFNVSGLRTDAAKILAQAFLDYGGYLVDNTGWDVYAIEAEWGPNGRVIDEFRNRWGFDFETGTLATCTNTSANDCKWAKDIADIFTNLAVVNNNSASSIGGGGALRQPCAPAFTDGSGAPPSGAPCNSAPAPTSTPPSGAKLTGAVIGTPGSWNNSGNTRDKCFDGNTSTFFDAPAADGGWCGLDLGSGVAKRIGTIRYWPRDSFASRMVNGRFQGSNTADFSSGVVDLYTITSTPPQGAWSSASVTNANTFRYLRYLAPNGGYGNVGEVEFYEASGAAPTSTPTVAPTSTPTPTPGGGTNLAQNPGFENDFNGWPNAAGTTSIVADPRSGAKAARLGDGTNVQGERQQNVQLTSGQRYTVSAYFKSQGSAWCSVGVKGSANGQWFDYHAEASGSAYTQASTTFVAPGGISFALLYVWKTTSTGTCTVDDVALTAN